LILGWGAGAGACSGPDPGHDGRDEESPPAPDATSARAPDAEWGRELYARQCAVCHGERGDGQGEAAYLLSPLPRDFGSGRFRLVSTENSVPSQADIETVLQRGMPGSAMPPFEWMQAAERASLALHVRQLAEDGLVRGLEAYAREQEEEFDEAEARGIARERMTAGAGMDVGEIPPASPQLLERGRALYAVSCAPCHGADGRARAVDVQWNEDGTPTRPRDFTAGIFKGGSSSADIVRRLRCGLPGSPMPSTELETPADAWALATFVRSLVPAGAEERVLQHRGKIVARRARTLPAGPGAPAWDDVPPVWLALTPLWWRDERVEGLELRALHDGKRLALELGWQDASDDRELLGTETFSDVCALQLTAAPEPPLFTMGAAGESVNIWSWKAGWGWDAARPRDVADRYPNLSADLYGTQAEEVQPLFLTARAVGNPMAREGRPVPGEELSAQGFGTLAPLSAGKRTLDVRAERTDGGWRVLFTRALASDAPEVVALLPGTRVFLAAAVWDGAAGDRNGQKSVTVWQELEIER
jgi:mono/diheme cytochrome c family protein